MIGLRSSPSEWKAFSGFQFVVAVVAAVVVGSGRCKKKTITMSNYESKVSSSARKKQKKKKKRRERRRRRRRRRHSNIKCRIECNQLPWRRVVAFVPSNADPIKSNPSKANFYFDCNLFRFDSNWRPSCSITRLRSAATPSFISRFDFI